MIGMKGRGRRIDGCCELTPEMEAGSRPADQLTSEDPLMSPNVLILSASAGAGHLRAAQAIERAFALGGSAHSVHHFDTLEFTNPLFRRLYSKAYIDMVNRMPEVLGWLYDRLDQPGYD